MTLDFYTYPKRKLLESVDQKEVFTNAERKLARSKARLNKVSVLYEIVVHKDGSVSSIRSRRIEKGLIDQAVAVMKARLKKDIYYEYQPEGSIVTLVGGLEKPSAFFYPVFFNQTIEFD